MTQTPAETRLSPHDAMIDCLVVFITSGIKAVSLPLETQIKKELDRLIQGDAVRVDTLKQILDGVALRCPNVTVEFDLNRQSSRSGFHRLRGIRIIREERYIEYLPLNACDCDRLIIVAPKIPILRL